MPSNNERSYGDGLLESEDQASQQEPSAVNEHLAEAQTTHAVREKILQRFAKWLDDVLAEETPLDGVAAELLAELADGSGAERDASTESRPDLYSTWSAITALTQEIKLQGRSFKHLSEKIEPLVGLGASVDTILEAHQEALSEARGIAEQCRGTLAEREKKSELEGYVRAQHELIGVMIDIRDKLIIGARSAKKSRRQLDEHRHAGWLNKILMEKITRVKHMREIVNSLETGYRLGLERLDEALQQIGVRQIECEGQPFDPRVMTAVDIQETAVAPEGTVLEVYRNGYLIDNEVLEPARVKVARRPEQILSKP